MTARVRVRAGLYERLPPVFLAPSHSCGHAPSEGLGRGHLSPVLLRHGTARGAQLRMLSLHVGVCRSGCELPRREPAGSGVQRFLACRLKARPQVLGRTAVPRVHTAEPGFGMVLIGARRVVRLLVPASAASRMERRVKAVFDAFARLGGDGGHLHGRASVAREGHADYEPLERVGVQHSVRARLVDRSDGFEAPTSGPERARLAGFQLAWRPTRWHWPLRHGIIHHFVVVVHRRRAHGIPRHNRHATSAASFGGKQVGARVLQFTLVAREDVAHERVAVGTHQPV